MMSYSSYIVHLQPFLLLQLKIIICIGYQIRMDRGGPDEMSPQHLGHDAVPQAYLGCWSSWHLARSDGHHPLQLCHVVVCCVDVSHFHQRTGQNLLNHLFSACIVFKSLWSL